MEVRVRFSRVKQLDLAQNHKDVLLVYIAREAISREQLSIWRFDVGRQCLDGSIRRMAFHRPIAAYRTVKNIGLSKNEINAKF